MDFSKINTTGWSPEQLAKLEALKASHAETAGKRAMLAAQEEARRNDVDELLRAEEERQEAEAEEVRKAEMLVRADAAHRAAVRRHGKPFVGRISTEVCHIILHAIPPDARKELAKRTQAIAANGEEDRVEDLAREAFADAIDFPPRDEFLALVEKYPGLWSYISKLDTELATAGARFVAGKG